jgi:hypothetical protein
VSDQSWDGGSDFGEPAGEELATCLVGRFRVTSENRDLPLCPASALPPKADVEVDAPNFRDGPNGDIPAGVDHELGYDVNSSSSAFASWRSRVSNPSVNQP